MQSSSNRKLRTMDSDEVGQLSTLHQQHEYQQYHLHQHQHQNQQSLTQSQQHHNNNNRQFPKKKKQTSNRKISLKQSTLKQVKDLSINQLVPRNKKSQLLSTSLHVNNNNSINYNNKSMIFSQQKLTHAHNYSVIKGSGNNSNVKVTNSDNKAKQYGVSIHCAMGGGNNNIINNNNNNVHGSTNKRQSTKTSTTKKHSKSVYNCYTEFDDCPVISDKKKHSKKQPIAGSGVQKSRDSHNRSTLTQHNPHHHQISTSSITKRVNKSKQTLNKLLLLNNTTIKKTTQNFKILSNCLKEYIKEEELVNNKVDVGQIIKLVRAFNKTEIGQLSRPLEELVCEMLGVIYVAVEKQKQKEKQKDSSIKQKQKGSQSFKKQKAQQQQKVLFQTPQRLSSKHHHHQGTFPSSIINSKHHKTSHFHHNDNNNISKQQIILTPNDISKTKKFVNTGGNDKRHEEEQQQDSYYRHNDNQSSLSKDLIKMEQGLEELKSQEKQLQKIIRQSTSSKKKKIMQKQQSSQEQQQNEQNQQQIEQKKIEIHRLKKILQKQKYLMEKIESLSESAEGNNYDDEEGYYYGSGVVREE